MPPLGTAKPIARSNQLGTSEPSSDSRYREAQLSEAGTVTSEQKFYEAEVKTYYDDPATGLRKRGWILLPVWKARQRRDADVRCKECDAPVKLMTAGPNNQPAAHTEHFRRFCWLLAQ
jgi:hypothetical protein